MLCPESGKPTLAGAGLLKMSSLAAVDNQENTHALTERQAFHVRTRLAVSWPLARCVAELHFGRDTV